MKRPRNTRHMPPAGLRVPAAPRAIPLGEVLPRCFRCRTLGTLRLTEAPFLPLHSPRLLHRIPDLFQSSSPPRDIANGRLSHSFVFPARAHPSSSQSLLSNSSNHTPLRPPSCRSLYLPTVHSRGHFVGSPSYGKFAASDRTRSFGSPTALPSITSRHPLVSAIFLSLHRFCSSSW
jgi:hypothetical protein